MSKLMKQLGVVLEERSGTKTKKKTREEKQKKKTVMTGYLLYAKENRTQVKIELVEGGNENPKPTEVITEVAKRWKKLNEEEQNKWNERAKTEVDEEN